MICCVYNSVECLDVLLKLGQNDLSLKDKVNKTAFDLARSYGAIECFEMLKEHQNVNNKPKNRDNFDNLFGNILID